MTDLSNLPVVYVNRKYWRPGSYNKNALSPWSGLLIRPDVMQEEPHRMCCLGFACQQLGVPWKAMVGRAYPWNLVGPGNDVLKLEGNSEREAVVQTLANINDNDKISDDVREGLLGGLAPALGFRFEFVGPDWYPAGVDPEVGRPPDEFMPPALQSQPTTAAPVASETAVPTPPPPAPRLAPSLLNFF